MIWTWSGSLAPCQPRSERERIVDGYSGEARVSNEPPQRVTVEQPVEVSQDGIWLVKATQDKAWQVEGAVSVDGPVTVSGTVGVDGVLETTYPPVANALPRTVPASATSVLLLAQNPDRISAIIYNDSTANLYIKTGAAASSTDFSVLLYPGQGYELPARYTGPVEGAWASATGQARVTDLFA